MTKLRLLLLRLMLGVLGSLLLPLVPAPPPPAALLPVPGTAAVVVVVGGVWARWE